MYMYNFSSIDNCYWLAYKLSILLTLKLHIRLAILLLYITYNIFYIYFIQGINERRQKTETSKKERQEE